MKDQTRGSLGDALAWLALPAVPAVLARAHYGIVNWSLREGCPGPDPFDWGWIEWVVVLGPLAGFGFLAGATLDLPDEPGARGWHTRRAVWVAAGPWAGLIGWIALVVWVYAVRGAFPQLVNVPLDAWWNAHAGASVRWWVGRAWEVFLVTTLCYAWLVPGAAALRRARRRGRLRPAFQRGLAVMVGFNGSLLGTFWTITRLGRVYFFDRTLVPVVLALAALTTLSGCAGTITYGEVRRRTLFEALLVSWVFGLALLWRWWSRPRGKP
jgi:hypothetical protein